MSKLKNYKNARDENKQSQPASAKKIAITIVFITLAVVASFAAVFYAGVSYQRNYNHSVETKAAGLVSSIQASK